MHHGYQYKKNPFDTSILNNFKFHPLPKGKEFCQLKNDGCIDSLLSLSHQEIKESLTDNEMFITRYGKFLEHSNFSSIKIFNYDAPFPKLKILEIGYMLNRLKIFAQIKNNKINTEFLDRQLTLVRRKLSQTDNLIAKMVLLAICNDYLELVSFVNQAHNNKSIQRSIKPLSNQELNTFSSLRNEHVAGLRIMYDVSDKTEWFLEPKKRNPWTIPLSKLFMSLVLKPNMTVNAHHEHVIKPMLEFLSLDARSFYLKYLTTDIKSSQNWIRNAFSSYYLSDSFDYKSMYLSYPARLHSLSMKIKLYNAYIVEGSFEQVIDKAKQGHQPYFNDYDSSLPFIKDNKICYSGLFEFNDDYRCLTIH